MKPGGKSCNFKRCWLGSRRCQAEDHWIALSNAKHDWTGQPRSENGWRSEDYCFFIWEPFRDRLRPNVGDLAIQPICIVSDNPKA